MNPYDAIERMAAWNEKEFLRIMDERMEGLFPEDKPVTVRKAITVLGVELKRSVIREHARLAPIISALLADNKELREALTAIGQEIPKTINTTDLELSMTEAAQRAVSASDARLAKLGGE